MLGFNNGAYTTQNIHRPTRRYGKRIRTKYQTNSRLSTPSLYVLDQSHLPPVGLLPVLHVHHPAPVHLLQQELRYKLR